MRSKTPFIAVCWLLTASPAGAAGLEPKAAWPVLPSVPAGVLSGPMATRAAERAFAGGRSAQRASASSRSPAAAATSPAATTATVPHPTPAPP